MPLTPIILNFTKPLNVSVQVGDMAYYCTTASSLDFAGPTATGNVVHQSASSTDIIKMGKIISLTRSVPSSITCWIDSSTPVPPVDSFIMFSKDNKVNLSSLLGYYAEVEFRNDSRTKAELFSVGTEIFESSK